MSDWDWKHFVYTFATTSIDPMVRKAFRALKGWLDDWVNMFNDLADAYATHIADPEAHQDLVTLGAGSDPILTLDGQELTLGAVVSQDEYDAAYGYMAPEIYPVAGLDFPIHRLVVAAQKIAAVFPKAADSGWGSAWQVAKKIGTTYNLGLAIEYHGTHEEQEAKRAAYRCIGRIVAVGERVDNGGTPFNQEILLEIPVGSVEATLRAAYFPLIYHTDIEVDDMVIVEEFYRESKAAGDTLDEDLLISGWKPIWTSRVPVGPT